MDDNMASNCFLSCVKEALLLGFSSQQFNIISYLFCKRKINNTQVFTIPEFSHSISYLSIYDIYLFIYLFILLRLGVTYIYKKKNIDDNYKTRQGHHNSKNQLLWAQIN